MKAMIVYMAGPALPRIVTLANGPASPLREKVKLVTGMCMGGTGSLRANLC